MDVDSSSSSESFNESVDRLSELPISLTHIILSFLPITDVVRTTILSKHWHNLWTTLHPLHFNFDANHSLVHVTNFVNGALGLWKGSKIFVFQLVFPFDQSCSNDLDSWLIFAMQNQVQQLHLNLSPPHQNDYFAPQSLYSSSSLTELTLAHCNLNFNDNIVQWQNLKSLTLENVCLGQDMMTQILRGSPLLQVLIFSQVINHGWNIESSSLKTLKLHNIPDSTDPINYFGKANLRLWAPNLETLEFSGSPYFFFLEMNVSSLKTTTLDFNDCFDQFMADMHISLLPRIHHAENVVFSNFCTYKVLDEEMKNLAWINAKFLKLRTRSIGDIIGVLEIFPNLSKLVIERPTISSRSMIGCICHNGKHEDAPILEFDPNDPKTDCHEIYLLQLRRIEIFWELHDKSMFRLIKALFKNSSMLEKIVFRVKCVLCVDRRASAVVANMLRNLPRSSANVEIRVLI